MNEDTAIAIIRNHFEGQFPKTCLNCRLVFNSLAEYIQITSPIGDPVSYDLEKWVWDPPLKPLETLIFSHCKCRSTISVSSKGMDSSVSLELLEWFRADVTKRGITVRKFLGNLRSEVRRRVLDESGSG
jgi:hypothetical protein